MIHLYYTKIKKKQQGFAIHIKQSIAVVVLDKNIAVGIV